MHNLVNLGYHERWFSVLKCAHSKGNPRQTAERQRENHLPSMSLLRTNLDRDCVATPTAGVTHVNSASGSQPHLSLTNMAFYLIKITQSGWKAHLSPCEKALKNRHLALRCENSDMTVTLPGWNQEMSGAASHPYAQCLWRNDSKFFLQEQDMRNYSFPQTGPLRETIHKQIKTIFLKYMYVIYYRFIWNKPMSVVKKKIDVT